MPEDVGAQFFEGIFESHGAAPLECSVPENVNGLTNAATPIECGVQFLPGLFCRTTTMPEILRYVDAGITCFRSKSNLL
jgi:hypothetical protein